MSRRTVARSSSGDGRETSQFRAEMKTKAECQARGPNGRFVGGYKPGSSCQAFRDGYGRSKSPPRKSGVSVKKYGNQGRSKSPPRKSGAPVKKYGNQGRSKSPVKKYGNQGRSKSPVRKYGAKRLSSEESLSERASYQPRGARGQFRSGYEKTAEEHKTTPTYGAGVTIKRSSSATRRTVRRPSPLR